MAGQRGYWVRVSDSAGRGLDLQEHDSNPVSAAAYRRMKALGGRFGDDAGGRRAMSVLIRSRYLSKVVGAGAEWKLNAARQSSGFCKWQ